MAIRCFTCLAGLLFLSVSQLDEFGPESKLSMAIANIEVRTKFHPSQKNHSSIGQSIMHFSDNNGCLQGKGLLDSLLPKINSTATENTFLITDAKECIAQPNQFLSKITGPGPSPSSTSSGL
jgi:hypothetical protein